MSAGDRAGGSAGGEEADDYDLVFVGSVGRNTVHFADGSVEPMPGGPIVHGALASTWSGKRLAVATRMSPKDADLLEPLKRAGMPIFVSPTAETSRGHIYYLSDDPDDRRHTLETSAGPFSISDIPPVGARLFHLAGINRLEFPLEFLTGLRDRGSRFTIDMQALVRLPDLQTGEVRYVDYPHKQEVAAMAEMIKLDTVEAEILTGTADPEQAAIQFEKWGTPEVMVTRSDGVLVRYRGRSYVEPFTARWVKGRTGRGDATFGSYLVGRLDFDVSRSVKFAAAVASLKLESAGLFTTTADVVLKRMADGRQR